MRVLILPTGSPMAGHPLTGFVIDGRLAIDAGPLGTYGTVEDQASITDVFLTHSHIDHVAGLPVFLDTVYLSRKVAPRLHAIPDTLRTLQKDLFNDRLMPDFFGLSKTMSPFVHLHELEANRPVAVGHYTITPLPIQHTVPAVAYLIDDRTTAVAIVTDTAPALPIIEPLACCPRLKAVFLECSFPQRLDELATVSAHLTTRTFLAVAAQFPAHIAVYAIHIKPRFYEEIVAELRAANRANVHIGDAGSIIEVV